MHNHLYNLFLAVLWAGMGVYILLMPQQPWTLGGVSVGWLGVLMGLYNLFKWWRYHAAEQQRRLEREAEQQRRAAAEPPDRPRDPNFIFDEPAP